MPYTKKIFYHYTAWIVKMIFSLWAVEVVSVLAFYSSDRSSNPPDYNNCLRKKTKLNEIEAEVGPSS